MEGKGKYTYKQSDKNKKAPKKGEIKLPAVTSYQPPRFDVNDPLALQFLEENGYAVFKEVANNEECNKITSLAWDYLESLGAGINRNDRNSWNTPKWPDPFGKGIVCSDASGHCEMMWYARSLPKVHTLYSKIWNTDELMTSFDGFCFWRPFEYNLEWRTQNAKWYHLDQNGSNKPHKLCIQGFLNVLPSGPDDGGLVIIPKSHTTIFSQIFANSNQWKGKVDWIPLHNNRALWENMLPKAGLSPIKVCAEAGDFVVWDSRIIHCNGAANRSREIPTDGTLLPPRRIVSYVCMTPKSRLNPVIIEERRKSYYSGDTTSHWPEDVTIAPVRRNKNKNYTPIPLSDYAANLIPL